MSPFARTLLFGCLVLLTSCQLPSTNPRKPESSSKHRSLLSYLESKTEDDWEPPLPGKDLPRAQALAYATREVLMGLTPDQRAQVLSALQPVDGDVFAAPPELKPNPAFPGFCGSTDPVCDAAPERADYVRVPNLSLEWPCLGTLRQAQATFHLWHPPSAPVEPQMPSLKTLASILDELSARLGSEELAVAALLLGPDVERRIETATRAPSLSRISGWIAPKRQPLVDHAREALTLTALYSMSWPVSTRAPLTSAFGLRVHPVLGGLRLHKGIDIAVPTGTEIRAPMAGTVRVTHDDKRNGLWVELDHGGGITTVYCHASELKVTRGQKVAAGDVIALSGETGIATGPHLHYQVHVAKNVVDPLRFRAASADAAYQQSQITAAGGAP